MREADVLVAAVRPSVTPGVTRYPPAFCYFGYKRSILYVAPSESNPEDNIASTSLLFGRWSKKQQQGRGERRWERKAANTRHVIKPARAVAVGQWSWILLGNSGRRDRTHLGVFPAKGPGSWGIGPPAHISHCGGMMEVGGAWGN